MMSDFAFELTPEDIEKNYNTLMNNINIMFSGDRLEKLKTMYIDLEDELMMAPASSFEHYHNSFPGGYLDHILRVLDFSFRVYETWKSCGMLEDDFTPEELAFVAIHHDLGKLGLGGDDMGRYVFNQSDWHRKNQGKIYDTNDNLPFMTVQDMSLFILQKYGINITMNETLGIKLHDGLYEESNKPYYLARQRKSSLRTYLPFVVHQADLMASRFEYDRWEKYSGKKLPRYKG